MTRMLLGIFVVLGSGALQEESARVLLVTGHDGPWHDWRSSAPVLKELLEADRRLQVQVLEDPHALERTDLGPFKAVILHFSSGPLDDRSWTDPAEEARRRLAAHVRGGGGLVVLHFACFAFRDWDGYEELAGRVWDRRTGHDPRGPFRVEIRNQDHPVTRGLAPFDADDELYTCLKGDRPVDVLAVARSRVTGREHPMAFVHGVGAGRVFHTPLGHDVRALRVQGTASIVRRGTAWTAGLTVR